MNFIFANGSMVRVYLLIFLFFIYSCNKIEKPLNYTLTKTKEKSTGLLKKIKENLSSSAAPDTFHISQFIPDFKNDPSVIQVKCIQQDLNFFYVEHCVYKANKNKVLSALNNSKSGSLEFKDEECALTDLAEFEARVPENEKNAHSKFFWKYKNLKDLEVYTCLRAPIVHYLIFDLSSDTVYHRMEEIRE